MPTPHRATPIAANGAFAPQPRQAAAHYDLLRLAALHKEAGQTAHLANLLGRAPYASALLAAAAGLTAILTSAPATQIGVWLMLVLFGAAALARAYRTSIRAPFERTALLGFAEDFKAILTYSGFAWGAGAFLVLPADCGVLAASAFAAGPALALAILLRARPPALLFAIPAVTMGSLAILVQALLVHAMPQGLVAVLVSLLAMAAIALAAMDVQRRDGRAIPDLLRPLL